MTLFPRAPALSAIFLALCIAPPPSALAQGAPPPSAGSGLADLPACTLHGNTYTCSQPALHQALASAHNVAIVSQPANHASDAALASLVKSLDKTVATGTGEVAADLTIRLTPIEPAGVSVGMGAVDLAMLNLFVATPGNPTAKLLWSETYNGNPDMPWASVARALTRQFKSRLGLK